MRLPCAVILFFLTLPLLSPAGALAQTVSFKVLPPAAKPKLAEPFKLRMELSFPDGYEAALDTASFRNDVFELLKIEKASSGSSGGLKTETFDLKVSAFETGVSTFPATTWLLRKGTETREASSPAFQLDIQPLFDEKSAPGDIRDIRPPFRFIPWLWLTAGLLAAAAAGWFLYRRFAARRKGPGLSGAAADTRSPYKKACDSVDELISSSLWQEGRFKEFYSRLTDIFRSYLDAQFGIEAERLTTGGITKELRGTGADIKTLVRTRELLEKADLAKFARFKPGKDDEAADVSSLRELLKFYSEKAEEKEKAAAAAAAAAAKAQGGGGK